ncbi:hypothetical protein OZL92_19530 [Bacillus sonorensis]|nr:MULTISPECIES: hypothetical protein [Bacillus]TWK72675.1 hypothetical protein CHCC20335_1340 [Bacillus paralicheniformis]MCF7619521.1 hypothetical protein [Bacillus sonorensis]MCY7855884.1 hypothetical protein [Bacillus sonorensis]MCY8025521.1 hypothetical protein [Bacillus sonorensis]MCY8032761.1 hypothetical protein [Bacillus sonorensis]
MADFFREQAGGHSTWKKYDQFVQDETVAALTLPLIQNNTPDVWHEE